ncbi:MAG TPA: hypothetical protein VJ043_02755, partial [Candidatus Paceibacterota bacterium]|nr:hypothetical protein [Candidatus Paceibacterota bacterium]
DPGHREECMKFAEENGFAQKRGEQGPPNGGGPAGCASPEECKALCESNPEACRGFGPPSEDGKDFGQDRAIERRGFEIPPGRAQCGSEEECKKLFENNPGAFNESFREQGGNGGRPTPPELERQYREQSSGEYQRQYQEQYQGQYQEQYQGAQQMQGAPGEPPREMTGEQQQMYQQYQQAGTPPPPPSSSAPPSEGTPPPTETNGSAMPPPPQESAPPPPSARGPSGFVASVFHVLDQLLR